MGQLAHLSPRSRPKTVPLELRFSYLSLRHLGDRPATTGYFAIVTWEFPLLAKYSFRPQASPAVC